MSELPKVCVISTGFNVKTKQLGIASVARQLDVDVEHRWVDAAEQEPPKSCPENLKLLVDGLPADRVVVWMDLDDWLAHRRALARVAQAHAMGRWVTYGSFKTSDGRRGFGEPYQTDDYRKEQWRASHLKSFRAGLLQRLRVEDLQHVEGGETKWLNRAVDLAIMFPVLEMAGRDRVECIRDTLCVYNFAASFEANAEPAEIAREKALDREVRSRRPYARLSTIDDPITPTPYRDELPTHTGTSMALPGGPVLSTVVR